jgi:SNF2 family DNA or RNA helicase
MMMETGILYEQEYLIGLVIDVWRDARTVVPDSPDSLCATALLGTDNNTKPNAWNDEFPLYDHQCNTLKWMKQLEEMTPLSVSYSSNIKMTDKWYVDIESQTFTTAYAAQSASITGGICSDGTGSGKTATLLHLMASSSVGLETTRPRFNSRASLVILPINLVAQWQREINKFIKRDSLRVHFLVHGKELRSMSMQQLCDADIVITTFHFLRASKLYLELVDSTLDGRPRTRAAVSSWLRQVRKEENKTEPILEAIYWRRVVVDELHNTFESPRDMRQLKLFRWRVLWGLTATPVLHTEQAQHLYMFLSRERAHHPNLLATIIHTCVRDHTIPVTTVPNPTRKLEWVQLSAEERMRLPLRLDRYGKNTVADIVRRCTIGGGEEEEKNRSVRKSTLQAKIAAHDRLIHILKTTAFQLEQEVDRLETLHHNGDKSAAAKVESNRHASDSLAYDIAIAEQVQHGECLKMEQLDTTDRFIREGLVTLCTPTCTICNIDTCNVLMQCCSHMCCRGCAKHAATFQLLCPKCKCPFEEDNMINVSVLNGMGTKLKQIGEFIGSLSEPVILFVQWKSMVRNTKTFLNTLGVRVLLLDGNTAHRGAILTEFATSGVLLICLEDSFAGLHLPHVRQIVFAHAIVGDRKQVKRLEQQAIARCVRHGQTEQVCISSFIVTESEEESLWYRTHN